MVSKYRMYVDESGTHQYTNVGNDRYLCLLGVIISEKEISNHFNPAWSDLRSLFSNDVDLPPCIHYNSIRRKTGVFVRLRNNSIRTAFDKQYMSIISERKFALCCVVLDKEKHFERYKQSAMHPYHYCFNVSVRAICYVSQ